MNKEQQELLDEVFENYRKIVWRITNMPLYTKEEFINKCKTDSEFSEKWGLKIEERELSYSERRKYRANTIGTNYNQTEDDFYDLDKYNIPTKLITIKYNDKTIESYE
jgi:hypothetical protein